MTVTQSIQDQTQLVAPRALCPRCGRLPQRTHLAIIRGMATATYLCEAEHSWLTKFLVDA
jgi:NMD protein affecting ribosome stability and mRNA decay